MYEKKINIFNDIDRKIFNIAFKYNIIFLIVLLIVVFTLVLWKKDYYYENIINFIDNKSALIVVNKKNINMVNNNKTLLLNNMEIKYYIDKIEERENDYILTIHFDNDIVTKTPIYKILLKKESLLEYVIRIIIGD